MKRPPEPGWLSIVVICGFAAVLWMLFFVLVVQ